MRIFIADRDLLLRTTLRILLMKEAGITIIGEASDGLSVLNKMKLHIPDVLLIDLDMPGLSGIEVVRILRQKDDTMRIIALFDHHNASYAQSTLQAGANGILFRNVECNNLSRKLEQLNNNSHNKLTWLN